MMDDDLDISEESLKTILISFLDRFSRLKNDLKGVLTRNQGFHRTELQSYVDAHPRRVKSYLKEKSYFDFSAIEVPVPDMFSSTYTQLGQGTADLLRKLDVNLFTSQATALMDALQEDDVSKRIRACRDFSRKAQRVTARDLKRLMDRHFSKRQRKPDLPAGEVIGSFRQLEETYRNVLTYKATYHQVAPTVAAFETIDRQVDDLISRLEADATPDRTFLKAFHEVLTVMSETMTVYGALIETLTRIEYSFTRGFRKIVDASFRD